MTENVELFYLVSEADYDAKFKQKPQLSDKLQSLPNRLEKKVRKILDFLLANGLTWNAYGVTTASIPELNTQFAILEFVIYCVKAQGKEPLGFQQFLKYLKRVEIPFELICKKVQRSLLKLKKDAKKKVKQESESEEIHFVG